MLKYLKLVQFPSNYLYIMILLPPPRHYSPYYRGMLVLRLDSIAPLLNATSILSLVAEAADFKCSPSIISLIVSQPPSMSGSESESASAPTPRFRFTVALQMMPQFFTLFSCDGQFCHYRILLHHFYTTLLDMEQHCFSSLTLCLPQLLHRLVLKFQNSR